MATLTAVEKRRARIWKKRYARMVIFQTLCDDYGIEDIPTIQRMLFQRWRMLTGRSSS